jgi:hypothetical protein
LFLAFLRYAVCLQVNAQRYGIVDTKYILEENHRLQRGAKKA